MQRKLTLARNAYLWEEGDFARNIAVVEKGKLAIKVGDEVVGVVLPRMVTGEGAVVANGNNGGSKRSASAISMEDDTTVVEYAPSRIKEAYDNAETSVGQQILVTLMGQTFRNLFLVLTAENVHPLTVAPVKGLLKGLIESQKESSVSDWKSFLTAFHILTSFRNTSEQLRQSFVDEITDDSLSKATTSMKEHFSGQDILPTLEEFFRAEQERADWLER
jgi:CRP-like cAMP-binding protein